MNEKWDLVHEWTAPLGENTYHFRLMRDLTTKAPFYAVEKRTCDLAGNAKWEQLNHLPAGLLAAEVDRLATAAGVVDR